MGPGARAIGMLLLAAPLLLPPTGSLAQQVSREVAGRFGLTPEQARLLYARVDGMGAQISELSRANGIKTRTLQAVALELGARNPHLSANQFVDLIEARAGDAARAQKRIVELEGTLAALDPGDERSRALAILERAQQAFDDGRLEAAEAAFGELSFLRASEFAGAHKAWGEAVDLQAQSAFVRGDMMAMDRILSAKSSELALQQQQALRDQWQTEMQRVRYWFDYGDGLGDNAALTRAIAIFRDSALPLVPRERVPLDWAATQNNLGIVLQVLGERESGTARLEEAVAAYRLALQEWTRERVPLEWGTTQNNLGNALEALGGRESGTARLEEAVAAYRLALEERTREGVPAGWAMTQNNLGNALVSLGERESGTARLEEAVSAYRLALEERTRDRVPLDWAATQNNLGNVLQSLGERESGTARPKEAVAAYRLALEERTRERVPLDWAATQNNLGTALQRLGAQESGTSHLEEAVGAYRLALEERTRERLPLAWAQTKLALSAAEVLIAQRTGNAGQLVQIRARVAEARQEALQGGHSRLVSYADWIIGQIDQ